MAYQKAVRLGSSLLEGRPGNALGSDYMLLKISPGIHTTAMDVLIVILLSSVHQLENYLILIDWLTFDLTICARKGIGEFGEERKNEVL